MTEERERVLYEHSRKYCCDSRQVMGTHGVRTLGHLEIDKPPI